MKHKKAKIKIDNKKTEKEFSLNQYELFEYGELLIRDIIRQYSGLVEDPDCCWGIHLNLEKLNKLVTMIVRLQNGRRLVEEK